MKLKSKTSVIDLKEYVWPDGFIAFKAYIIFCYLKKKSKLKKVTSYVRPVFIKDVLYGMYDDNDHIKRIELHEQKQDLCSIKDVKIAHLIDSNPMLLTHLI